MGTVQSFVLLGFVIAVNVLGAAGFGGGDGPVLDEADPEVHLCARLARELERLVSSRTRWSDFARQIFFAPKWTWLKWLPPWFVR